MSNSRFLECFIGLLIFTPGTAIIQPFELMMYKMSVIIPAYNEELYIGRTLQSLVSQDYQGSFEIIVVNNASADRTRQMAESFNVKVVDEPKKGISNALIKGCGEATGEIFVFTDADTELPYDWLSMLNARFDDDPEAVAFGGPYSFYDGDSNVNFFAKKVFFPVYKLVAGGLLPCVNMAVRREAYEKTGGFNPEMNWGQDIDLSKRLGNVGKVCFDTDIVVWTSFRRYSGGYDTRFARAAHAFKEFGAQLGRCYMVSVKGKVYRNTQRAIREVKRLSKEGRLPTFIA